MANPEHVEIVKQGAEAINEWFKRQKNLKYRLDLKGAKLSGIELRNASLRLCSLDEVDLSGSDLARADFSFASMEHAKLFGTNASDCRFFGTFLMGSVLNGSNLSGTNFVYAVLDSANLTNTQLNSTSFCDTVLTNVNFTGAILENTVFANSALNSAIGLGKVKHEGPSSIGLDTIINSQGNIPLEFLRGCGLPDDVIEYVQSLSKKPIQYYTCFISHSSYDADFAKHLFDKLQGSNVRCWYFPESARTGEKLWGEINKAIHLYDKLVIICSQHSLESEAVLKEIEEGLKREQAEAVRRLRDQERVNKGEMTLEEFERQSYHLQVLFPITIDDYIFDGWKHSLKHELCRNRVVGDFRDWKNYDSFNKAFDKLLRDLNSAG